MPVERKHTQHIEYLPYGEPSEASSRTPLKIRQPSEQTFFERRLDDYWNTPYKFNAKELDEETGMYYYGARYYTPEVSIWLSVDPLADKYPSMSAFMYCAGNPVILVDPDGREIGEFDEEAQAIVKPLIDKNSDKYNKAFARKFKKLEKSDKVYNIVLVDKSKSNQVGEVSENNNGSIDVEFSINKGNRTSSQGGFSPKYATLFEEVFHAVEYDKGKLDLNNPTCRDEAKAWKFAAKAPGTNYRVENIYNGEKTNDYTLAHTVSNTSVKKLATWFKTGKINWIDAKNREHFMINYSMKPLKGLYYYLPEK